MAAIKICNVDSIRKQTVRDTQTYCRHFVIFVRQANPKSALRSGTFLAETIPEFGSEIFLFEVPILFFLQMEQNTCLR